VSKQVVSCAGYGGTGSSAITDLLKEFDSCLSIGNVEFWFLQDYDGVSDLEYALVDGNHRSKVSLAIQKYRNYILNNNKFYSKFFGDGFLLYSNEFLEELIDSKFRKACSYAEETSSFKRFFFFQLSPLLQIIFKKVTFQSTFEFSPWVPVVEKTYTYLTLNKFSKVTKKYTGKLFAHLDKNNKHQNLILDQLVPTTNIKRYFNYVDNLKVIVVDRDPRDLYLLNQLHWKGASYICDTSDVNEYISWYKSLRMHRNHEDLNNENIITINFEELIYEYEDTVIKICDFLNINIQEQTYKKKYFDPKISIKNTKLWESEHNYQNEIKSIEKELSKFLYDK
jgi:hypothetical protein